VRRLHQFPAIAASLILSAATLAAQSSSTFRAETRLVVLHATVKNDRGELVPDLDRGAFTVYENGRRQPIALFRRDDIPVSLGLLIDNSGSMRTSRGRVEAAALAFVRASNPDDEIFVVNFADKARLDVTMTRDVASVEAGIARVDSIGGTALRDTVQFAEQYLRDHATRDRRALLIVTDGKDNASETTLKEIQTEAERSETTVFGIGLFVTGDAEAKQGRKELEDLTARTGGVAYYPADADQIETVAVDLAKQIRRQYTIGYTPTNQALDNTYRTVRVEADGGARAGRLTVRTRPGYRASRTP
jgi:Ca-activated chloride channel family protein